MELIVFDLDGTLVDSEKYFLENLQYALSPFSIEANREFIEKVRSLSPLKLFESVLNVRDAKLAMERLEEGTRESIYHIHPFHGIIDILEELKKNGISMALWTGRDGRSAKAILENTGMSNYFSEFRSGTCVQVNKPSVEGLSSIIESLKVSAQKTVMVGDHSHDIDPGLELGCTTVHVRWKPRPQSLIDNLRADYQFDKLSEFKVWTQKLLKSARSDS